MPDARDVALFWSTDANLRGTRTTGMLPNITGQLTGLKSVAANYTNGIVKWVKGNSEGVYGSGGGAYGTFYLDASLQKSAYSRTDNLVVPASLFIGHVFIKY